ncbi:Amine oxidase domain-containing protein [Caenorhabditis elegans]|uniref:Amine oxidase domain-containing protein n=2 Tax=Caenorhabditis elegans TaxID=6239 RepID=E0AHD3_CAEEL|nr:Amine oxidase domain-containing protein [Caenorhabditis elegans]CBW44373.2 Amine oxidase domain-containing protein [Caenorhabditis elegans]|eukprot:NP_001355373.1 AMine oXidase family [Caenorhabditis elegans]
MVKVCIIGAGLAGLRSAIHFEQVGIDYTIFEGSNRIGGRVYPFEYQDGYLHFGAEYVNGVDNEVYNLVEKYDLFDKTKPRTDDLWMLDQDNSITLVNGHLVPKKILDKFNDYIRYLNVALYEKSIKINQLSVENEINNQFIEFLRDVPENDHEIYESLINVYKNYFQTEWSSPVGELSLSNLSIWDDGTEEEDSAVLNKQGFYEILKDFRSKIPAGNIRLNCEVINVKEEENIMVTLKNGEVLHFDACIVTCSLGYLKKHHKTLFTPQLTSVKQDAINRMGFGNNLKVFLEYSDSWWNSLNTILILTHGENEDFMVFQPSSWAENILLCWIAGSGPKKICDKTDFELKILLDTHLHDQLKNYLDVKASVKIYRKNWINDEFTLGSYSYLTPGQIVGEDICILAQPVLKDNNPVICFAGEHTDSTMYQTTVGAVRSGLREASRISEHTFEK